jgi:Fic family protein
MENKIYTFLLIPDWKLMSQLGKTDKFGGSWESIEKREGQSLKQLKSIATVKSVGASTRIEGSSMTDDEVSVLISNLEVSMLEDRDEQEVAGYFETLDLISGSFEDIPVTESSIQSLHHLLMKHSEKDAWHRGKYKQHSNVVEATHPNGEKYIIFRTTDPGFATEDAMRQLISWYNSDTTTHPVIRSALFVYDFLSIHPFQDGNGRLSRLLATLLLLKEHYSWIQYVSFEHEIESRKAEYYKVLMDCQGKRPGEDVYPWVDFFLDCLNNIQASLLSKLDQQGSGSRMSPKEKRIYLFIESHPGARSGEIAGKLDIPLPTVKKMLAELTLRQVILKQGVGKGTYYTIV